MYRVGAAVVRARRGPGIFHQHRPGARRCVAPVHRRHRAQAEQILLKDPEVAGVFSVMGFSFSGAAPNQGLIFAQPEAVRPAEGRRAFAADGAGADSRTVRRQSAARTSSPLRRRRFPGLVRSAGSSSRCSTSRAGHQRAGERHLRHGRRREPVAEAAGAVQHRSRPTTRSSASRSIAIGRWRSDCR